jgi:uncharacterized protein
MKNKVRIKFKGITPGYHDYQFVLDDSFFSKFEESEIKEGTVQAKIQMIAAKDLLTFRFHLSGLVKIQCDRCLDNYLQAIEHETTLFVEFGEENSDISDADNRIMLSHKEHEIVLDKHLYDYVHLSLPYQRIHPENENGVSQCNSEMIKKIEELNNNETNDTDPRWDKLKELFN